MYIAFLFNEKLEMFILTDVYCYYSWCFLVRLYIDRCIFMHRKCIFMHRECIFTHRECIFTHSRVYIYAFASVYLRIRECIFMHSRVYIYAFASVYLRIRECIYTHSRVYIYATSVFIHHRRKFTPFWCKY